MNDERKQYRRPYGTSDYELVRCGAEGTYWQREDGMVVHLSAPEGARRVARDAVVVWLLPLLALARTATER